MGTEGIEIQAKLSAISRVVGRLMSAAHLDHLLKASADSMKLTMVITLDGVERREPLYEAHFVPCEPGVHQLTIAWEELGPTMGAGIRKLSSRSVEITVEPGKVAVLEYMPGDQPGNIFSHLSVMASRPALSTRA
jgi:hypothetical protein